MNMENLKSKGQQLDFSQPWKFSDVVLVVEDERLHVHRAVLAMSSPVFEKLFTSEFRDKGDFEIPLPGKSSTEVKELLRMIYPSARQKQITEENSHFLLKLAHEYQMEAIVQRCEDFVVDKLKAKPNTKVLEELVFAQTYRLKKLRQASVEKAGNLTLDELKRDEMYDQIQSENLQEIVEGMIRRLERELGESQRVSQEMQQKIKLITSRTNSDMTCALEYVGAIARSLVSHAALKHNFHDVGCVDTRTCIDALKRCNDFSNVSIYLENIQQQLESGRKIQS